MSGALAVGIMILLRSTFGFGFRVTRPSTSSFRVGIKGADIGLTARSSIRIDRIYHHGRLSLSAVKVPHVEISPADHGTIPLPDFASSSSMLDNRLVQTLSSSMNITTPTPIQSHALPLILNKYDVMASSATGR